MIDNVTKTISHWELYLWFNQNASYILGALTILALTVIMRRVLVKFVFAWIKRNLFRSGNHINEKILLAIEKPAGFLLLAIGAYLAFRFLPLSLSADAMILKIFRSVIIIVIGWSIYRLAGADSILSDEVRQKLDVDTILVPFLSKAIRFVVIALIIVMIANEFEYDVNGFIAGLGLGGLAFALAAKDALANIFGGVVIILEKPFSIGDWISTPSVEGTVESITFRSTLIRSFDEAIITVPNSTLANEPITNYTRRGKRRINYHLKLSYLTSSEQMQACVERIKQMLNNHSEIHPQTVIANFESFGESSLDIIIYCFTKTTVWNEYLEVRQDINLKIMKIMEDMNIKTALPGRTLYWAGDPASPGKEV